MERLAYSLAEIAEMTHLSERTLYRHMEAGYLRATKIGKQWRVMAVELQRYLTEGTAPKVEEVKASEAPKRRRRRQHPQIDPIVLYRKGQEALEAALDGQTVEELHDIIGYYGLDLAQVTKRWKKRSKLVAHIVEAAERRANHGSAFWQSR